jgi:hypothetical protein
MPAKKLKKAGVKKPKTYTALRKKGMSKKKAAKISNSQAKKKRK